MYPSYKIFSKEVSTQIRISNAGSTKILGEVPGKKKPAKEAGFIISICDPAGTRTQGPYIKSVLLYQLSYQIIPFVLGLQK